MATITELGEVRLIEHLRGLLQGARGKAGAIVGIGDDAAVLPGPGQRLLLFTCDSQVEEVHFRWAYFSPRDVGWRSLAVNISDIAAMGGTPGWALVSLFLPAGFSLEQVDAFYQGMLQAAEKFGVAVVGGNLSTSPAGFLADVALLGEVDASRLLTRSGARPGDLLAVTGTPGASLAGFYLLNHFNGQKMPPRFRWLARAHCRPQPRLQLAQALAASGGVTAMIDISDGLSSDLFHLCRESGVGARVDAQALPIHPDIAEVAALVQKTPRQLVLQGGEDYELLFTWRSDQDPDLLARIARHSGVNIRTIGQIRPAGEGIYLWREGERISLQPEGWDHFRKTEEEGP